LSSPHIAQAEAAITLDGTSTDLKSLWDWLRREPELRGLIRVGHPPTPTGTMGIPVELIVALSTTTAAVASVLARSLSVWIIQQRSDVSLRVTGPAGQRVTLDAKRITDAEKLLRAVLETTGAGSSPAQVPEAGQQPDAIGER
jgi:hypothetical protein